MSVVYSNEISIVTTYAASDTGYEKCTRIDFVR